MKVFSFELVKKMDDLAIRSLPPDLFEKWEEVCNHYKERNFLYGCSDFDDKTPTEVILLLKWILGVFDAQITVGNHSDKTDGSDLRMTLEFLDWRLQDVDIGCLLSGDIKGI